MSSLEIRVDPSAMGLDLARLERIRPHFDAYVEDRRLPGWLATVARGGELVWTAKGGYRDREKNLEVTDDTIWRIYSMTKPITSIAVMMLYEEGRFDLNDDVGQWIDELKEPRVWAGGTAAKPITVPAIEPVRVHHLLSQMSGLTYGFHYAHPTDEIYRIKGYDFGFAHGADLAQAVHDWCSSPLVFQPGSEWNYSVSVDVLGRLIEIWSGQSFESFLQERVLGPLQMTDTDWYCPEEKWDRLAMLYVPHGGDSFPFEELAKGAMHAPRIHGGGGGLVSSASDYQRFMTMLLRRRRVGRGPSDLESDARADDAQSPARGRRPRRDREGLVLRDRVRRHRLRTRLLGGHRRGEEQEPGVRGDVLLGRGRVDRVLGRSGRGSDGRFLHAAAPERHLSDSP